MATRKKKPTAPDNFPQKHWDKLNPAWREGAESKQTEDLESEILTSEKNIVYQEKLEEEDERLNSAKEELKGVKETIKDLSCAYRDSISADQAKIKYCLYLMETRGSA